MYADYRVCKRLGIMFLILILGSGMLQEGFI